MISNGRFNPEPKKLTAFRLRNAARLCAVARYRRIGTLGELACRAVCGERCCGPGLLCSVCGDDPVPPVTGYLCRYCRQRSAPGEAPVSCPLCGAPLDVRPAVSGSGWMRSRGRSRGMIEARGPGHIGVAENRAGEVIALPLRRG